MASPYFTIVNPDVGQKFPNPPDNRVFVIVKTTQSGLDNGVNSYTASIEDQAGTPITTAKDLTVIPGAYIVYDVMTELGDLPEGEPSGNNRQVTIKAYNFNNQQVGGDEINQFKAWLSTSSGSSSDSSSSDSSSSDNSDAIRAKV